MGLIYSSSIGNEYIRGRRGHKSLFYKGFMAFLLPRKLLLLVRPYHEIHKL